MKALAAQPAPAQASTMCAGAENREIVLQQRSDLVPSVVKALRALSGTGLSIDTSYADWVVWLASRMIVRVVPLSPSVKKVVTNGFISIAHSQDNKERAIQRGLRYCHRFACRSAHSRSSTLFQTRTLRNHSARHG